MAERYFSGFDLEELGQNYENIKQIRREDPMVINTDHLSQKGEFISFDWVRKNFGRDNDLWEQIYYGKNTLHSVELLDQYLYSYGPMIKCHWINSLYSKNFTGSWIRSYMDSLYKENPSYKTHIIDYGCGQGLAGVLINDYLGNDLFARASSIRLIEPSLPALLRAHAIYKNLSRRGG